MRLQSKPKRRQASGKEGGVEGVLILDRCDFFNHFFFDFLVPPAFDDGLMDG